MLKKGVPNLTLLALALKKTTFNCSEINVLVDNYVFTKCFIYENTKVKVQQKIKNKVLRGNRTEAALFPD